MKFFAIIASTLFLAIGSYGQDTLIDRYSLTSTYIIGRYNDKPLLNATGFVLRVKEKLYLVSNAHVFGGKYYNDAYFQRTHKLPPIDSIPNVLWIRLPQLKMGMFNYINIPLNNQFSKKPAWLSFYDSTALIDVAAIEITLDLAKYVSKYNILDSSMFDDDIALSPSDELFIVGFPEDYGLSNIFPIWKRGTIATEFNISNTFLVDATTRQGMSGSPVFFRGNTKRRKDGGISLYNGIVTSLIGIYHAQYFNMEIGEVIKMKFIYDKIYRTL